nr:uncharacterized mitochondrial protein AtMg00810-like [Tanacetum cinerariifolium]
EEEVYVCQPLGFEDPDYPDKVYKVVKVLYGLHQASRAWYETLANYLLENGFQRGKIDQALFIKKQKGDILLVQVDVNDIIFCSTNKDLCKAFEKLMKDKFQMSLMGELTFFLGQQVKQKHDGIFISQDKYVAEILRKFGLIDEKLASTPIDTEKPLLKDPGDASEGFKQILDFLNASVINYALTVNPTIYVSCIKQFWSSVSIKKTNDVVRLRALIDRKKLLITEDTVRQALRLDDAKSIDCLPNEEIFADLARMGPVRNVDSSSKFYMYPRFLQLMIAAQVGNLSFHTTKYPSIFLTQKVFANMRRVGKGFSGVDTPLLKGMLVPQQVADDVVDNIVADDVATDAVADEVADVVAEDALEPTPPSPTPATTPPTPQQGVTSTLPLSPHQSLIAQPSLSPQQQPSQPTTISIDLLNTLLETCTTLTRRVEILEQDKVAQALEITKIKQRVRRLEKRNKVKASGGCIQTKGIIAELDADKDITLEEVDATKDAEVGDKEADVQGRLEESHAQVYHIDLEYVGKVLSMQDDEPEAAELKEVIEVVTTDMLMTEVVTTAASTTTAAPNAARRRKGLVIRDPKETATPSTTVHSEPKSKDKGKVILVEEPKPLKKQAQIEQDEAYAREGMSYDDIRPIFKKHFNSNVAFLEKSKEQLKEEASKALKRKVKVLSSKQPRSKSLMRRLILIAVSSKLMLFGLTIDVARLMLLELIPSSSQVAPTPPPTPHQSLIAQPSSPSSQKPSQPLQTINISMDLLNTLLETCTTLTRRVENLEQDKIGQALEITRLKQRVRRLEKKRKLKASRLTRLRKGRLEESQAQVYHLDLEHAEKVLSMHDDEAELAKLKEVIKVVTTAKLITEVVTIAATTIIVAKMPKASAARRRKGVVIRDPKETATPSVIMHYELKSKDKGKGILVEEPKPLKKQAQIEQNEAYARELKVELNANINWNKVIKHARKNMMVYLKNMAGFKMDFFKGMTYDEIRPIFKKHFNSIVAFLEKGEKELEEEASKQSKRKSETSEEKAAKKQKLDEEVYEFKTHLQIIPNDEDDVYTEATHLDLKVPVVDYQIHTEHNKPYYKIIRVDGTHQLFLSFISLLRNFNREDLEMLWKIVQERFAPSEPKNFSYDFLLNTLKTMFEKPNVEAHIWNNQRGSYGLAKIKGWKLLESCGVHIITFVTTQMILLVERRYHLTRFTLDQMLNNVRIEVEKESKVLLELLKDFKEYTLRGYYCWLKTYCCWCKLKLLDNVVGSRLRLLEENDVAVEKDKEITLNLLVALSLDSAQTLSSQTKFSLSGFRFYP